MIDLENVYKIECRCPTCRAVQPWQDECRRCGTDLSDLRCFAEESENLLPQLLTTLKENRFDEAESILKRLKTISPTPLIEALLHFTQEHRRQIDDSSFPHSDSSFPRRRESS